MPEIVRNEGIRIVNGVKNIRVGNIHGHYAIACNSSLASCVTPMPAWDYYLVTKSTRFTMPGGKGPIDLEWLQSWSITYTKEENIGLIPINGGDPNGVGMYWFLSWNKIDH